MSYFLSLPLSDSWERLVPDQVSLQRVQRRIIWLSCSFVIALFMNCRILCRSWNQLTLERRIEHLCRAFAKVVSLGISARLAFSSRLLEARIMLGLLYIIYLVGLPALRGMLDAVGLKSLPIFFCQRLQVLFMFVLWSAFLCGTIAWKALLLYLLGLCPYLSRQLWYRVQDRAAVQQIRPLGDGAYWVYVIRLLTFLIHFLKRWWRIISSDSQVVAGTSSLPRTTIGARSTTSFGSRSLRSAWDEPVRDPVSKSDEQWTASTGHTHEVGGSSSTPEVGMNDAPAGLGIEQLGDGVLETSVVACQQPWDLMSAHTIDSLGSSTAELPNLMCDGVVQ